MFGFKRENLSLTFIVKKELGESKNDNSRRTEMCSDQLLGLRTPHSSAEGNGETCRLIWDRGDPTKESGASLVEFTMVLPILMMLVLGIIQYGYLLGAYVSLRSAAAVGARAAVLDPAPTEAQIRAMVIGSIDSLLDPQHLVTPIDVTTNYTIPGGSSGATRVSLTYNMPLFFSTLVPGVGDNGTFTLTAETIMR